MVRVMAKAEFGIRERIGLYKDDAKDRLERYGGLLFSLVAGTGRRWMDGGRGGYQVVGRGCRLCVRWSLLGEPEGGIRWKGALALGAAQRMLDS